MDSSAFEKDARNSVNSPHEASGSVESTTVGQIMLSEFGTQRIGQKSPAASISVIVNDEGLAIGISVEEKRQPALSVASHETLDSVINSEFVVAQFRCGLKALVVVDISRQPIGLLTIERIRAELAGRRRGALSMGSDNVMSGPSLVPELVVTCKCGAANNYVEINLGTTMCSAGHPLELGWE